MSDDDNIDLDALFDSLNINASQLSDMTTIAPTAASAALFEVNVAEIQELSPLDAVLFSFDYPPDQS